MADGRFEMTRRGLIAWACASVAAWAAAVGCASRPNARSASPLSAASPPRSEAGLAAQERGTLLAFGEVLVEGRNLPPEDRAHLAQHLDDRAARGGDSLALYRTAVEVLDRFAGGRFAALSPSERVGLVSLHRLAAPPSADEHLTEDVRALRMRLVPDLIRGYYGSPAGWAAVGYASFPGRCGDLMRYTGPES